MQICMNVPKTLCQLVLGTFWEHLKTFYCFLDILLIVKVIKPFSVEAALVGDLNATLTRNSTSEQSLIFTQLHRLHGHFLDCMARCSEEKKRKREEKKTIFTFEIHRYHNNFLYNDSLYSQ